MANAFHVDDYHWLVGTQAEGWLQRATDAEQPLHCLAKLLRKDLSAERTHLILEQVALRRRASKKFAQAERMFFTSTGLEQATDEFVATHKAQRFPPTAPTADLCCGIGGDLLGLAVRGPVTGVDRDQRCTILAAANARHVPGPLIAYASDVAEFDPRPYDAWHIDPDRRVHGHRTTNSQYHQPAPAAIQRLLDQNPRAAVKLAPAARLPDHWAQCAELEWISRGRECRQLVAWFGELARHPGRHRATVLGDGPHATRTVLGTVRHSLPCAHRVDRFLFEPDPAVLAARLTAELADQHRLQAVAPGCVYLTGSQPVTDSALVCFEVTAVLPFQVKRLRALLRERGIGQLEIKRRGVSHDPQAIHAQLRVPGDRFSTLLLTRINQRVTAILAQRIGPTPPSIPY